MGHLLERKRRSLSPSSSAILLPLVLAFFLTFCAERSVVSCLEYSKDRPTSNLTLEEIKEFLKTINKPAVMTFERNGDIIDCVDIHKQPAFDNPLLKNHQIQENPSVMPEMEKVNGENNVSSSMNEERKRMNEAFQQWYQNMTRCPQGTVPIRRRTVEDVLRAGSISVFGKKVSKIFAPDDVRHYHEYAVAYTNLAAPIIGAAAEINGWNPSLGHNLEMSVAQIWVAAGEYESGDLNTIEAGWQVAPLEYHGERSTRLFGYWTRDGYRNTGCYNADCGFVQIDPIVHVGIELSPLSAYAGEQYAMYVTVIKDISTGNWWLKVATTLVGYWPMNLFTHLSTGAATKVHWGGEVVNLNFSGRHTTTQMGSGHFPSEGYKRAAYFRSLGLVSAESPGTINPPDSLSTQADNRNCYDISIGNTRSWGLHFFYGGPGFGPRCP